MEVKRKKESNKFGIIFFAVVMIFLAIYLFFGSRSTGMSEISYTQFLNLLESNKVSSIYIIDGSVIQGSAVFDNGQMTSFSTQIPYNDATLMDRLREHQVSVNGRTTGESFWDILISLMPWIFTIFFVSMIFRQNAAQSSKGVSFGKSRARIYDEKNRKILFSDVAGQEEAKEELKEVVDFLKDPKKYRDIGAKIPTGILLVGNPGTGKTLLARAVAGEAGVNFLHISGSDFVEMFVGVGASRVRDLFEQGRKMAPAIIFIDEIDAVGRARGTGLGGGHDEREQTLNQMLVEMDGFDNKTDVIVLAATNRPDVLDAALLRPGRFDRQVTVSLPDIKEREAILNVHAKNIRTDSSVDLAKIARATPGMSGADLSSIVNEAALYAARTDRTEATMADFERARDKILMGVERKSMVLPEKERIMTAYHEAGHALPYYYLKNSEPLHKVTIIPRGRALGVTIGLPKEDAHSYTSSFLNDRIAIMFGGYAAETLIYGETTTGTQNDIQQATNIARRMVCEWGMAPSVGAVSYGQEDEPIFMGRELARHKELSDITAHEIDVAIKEILSVNRERVMSILQEHKDQLTKLAEALVEKETLDDSEIRTLLGFEPLSPEEQE